PRRCPPHGPSPSRPSRWSPSPPTPCSAGRRCATRRSIRRRSPPSASSRAPSPSGSSRGRAAARRRAGDAGPRRSPPSGPAAGSPFASASLPAGTGALLLFGAVQATMIIAGLVGGERLRPRQGIGLACALGGLVLLMLPGLSTPSLAGATLMVGAGVS